MSTHIQINSAEESPQKRALYLPPIQIKLFVIFYRYYKDGEDLPYAYHQLRWLCGKNCLELGRCRMKKYWLPVMMLAVFEAVAILYLIHI